MTTVTQMRKAMLACAAEAIRAEPSDRDARARSFIARLSGSMVSLGETELERALDQLLGIGAAPGARAGEMLYSEGNSTPASYRRMSVDDALNEEIPAAPTPGSEA